MAIKPADALSQGGKERIKRLETMILEFEPLLAEFIANGFPFEEYQNVLQERKLWNYRMQAVFLNQQQTTAR